MALILIVDDDAHILMLLAEVLTKLRHEVLQASDGVEAIPLIQSNVFDLVISDLHMKKMGGIEVLRAAKERDPDAAVLILTGYGTVHSAVKAMKSGAFDYLTKPLNIEELRFKVNQALEHRSLKRQMLFQAEELRAHQEIIERDLKLATTIQQTLIPRSISNEYFAIQVEHQPIIGVGGDFADISYDQNGRLYMTLLDVTGHGIAAALIVNRLSSEIRHYLHKLVDPNEILFQLNNFIFDTFYRMGMFLTAFACVIDLRQAQFFYAGSAHPPILWWQRQSDQIQSLHSQNIIIGFQKQAENTFIQNQVHLQKGDRLLLYTDGFLEVENEQNEQWGIDGVIAAFRATLHLPLLQVTGALMQTMNQFRHRPIRDDIYLVVLELK